MKKTIFLSIAFTLLVTMLCSCSTPVPDVEENNNVVQIEAVDDNSSESAVENETISSEQEEKPSAFDKWIDVENTSSERFMYEALIEGFIIVDDEIAHGWVDAGTKAFLRVIKGESLLLDAPTGEYIDAYRELDEKLGDSDYCIRDFFTVDDYDNSTNSGIYNFLKAIDQLEDEFFDGRDLVTFSDDNGISWDFDDTEVANAMGISEELITILMHAAVDAGFSITFN